jgi:glycosyltransferase involved in cell wall biosynthesis
MAKNRILMIAPVDISKDFGSKIHFSNLMMNFNKLGFSTRSIIYFPGGIKKDELNRHSDTSFVPNPLLGNMFFRVLKYLFVIPFIVSNIFRFKPNLIYIQFSAPALFYQLVLKCLKFFSVDFKVVLEFHDWIADQRVLEGHSRLKVITVAKLQLCSAYLADSIRVVAEGIKEKLSSLGIDDKKISVVENGTDPDLFKPIDRKKAKKLIGVNPDYLYIGFIGMFAVWQGLDYLLRAIPEILRVYKDIRFLMVGDGPLMPTIKKAVSKFEKGKVILTGRVPYQKANLYINAFDIGVAPFIKKRNDGMVSPMKIRDYAACGVPIITTKIRGLEMVEEESIGILVPPDNPEALSEALIKLIENPDLRHKMGKRGREIAEKEFSWEKIAEKILKVTGI